MTSQYAGQELASIRQRPHDWPAVITSGTRKPSSAVLLAVIEIRFVVEIAQIPVVYAVLLGFLLHCGQHLLT